LKKSNNYDSGCLCAKIDQELIIVVHITWKKKYNYNCKKSNNYDPGCSCAKIDPKLSKNVTLTRSRAHGQGNKLLFASSCSSPYHDDRPPVRDPGSPPRPTPDLSQGGAHLKLTRCRPAGETEVNDGRCRLHHRLRLLRATRHAVHAHGS
jgi:hypothetical protein